jgi:vacuolar-type H+-ATPase subunit E/Vma4
MTESTILTTSIIVGAVAITALLLLVLRVWILTKRLHGSFGKLGYMVREDAKKYFDDAAIKIVDTNDKFRAEYMQIVEEGTQNALKDSGAVMEKAISDAQKEAGEIILQARQNANQIVASAKTQSTKHYYDSLNRSIEAMDWTLAQYVDTKFSVAQHREVIEKLLNKYLDENRH